MATSAEASQDVYLIGHILHGVKDGCALCLKTNLHGACIGSVDGHENPILQRPIRGCTAHRFTISSGSPCGVDVQEDWLCSVFVLQI